VMSCFHENPRIEDPEGKAFEGRAAVRRNYETAFVSMPDCRCDLRSFTGNSGHAMAESYFHGTTLRSGKVIQGVGAEVMEIVDGKIKEIRDYHRSVPKQAA
ncbi:MAG TPA: nuclear transport factor 2 family protein, partial [Candidatus Acidoferrales bacterium]|nr:nuclear transport factor 2 family protein [Candidatus Acidoferrales bacterium]